MPQPNLIYSLRQEEIVGGTRYDVCHRDRWVYSHHTRTSVHSLANKFIQAHKQNAHEMRGQEWVSSALESQVEMGERLHRGRGEPHGIGGDIRVPQRATRRHGNKSREVPWVFTIWRHRTRSQVRGERSDNSYTVAHASYHLEPCSPTSQTTSQKHLTSATCTSPI